MIAYRKLRRSRDEEAEVDEHGGKKELDEEKTKKMPKKR